MVWFLLLVLWPLAELFVIIKISEAFGFLWMLLLLFVSWPIGWRLIRHQGRGALRRLRDALAMGRAPTTEVVDGALVLLGALLLLVPGFITDAIGVLLLLPITRTPARRLALRNHRTAWLRRAVAFVSWGARGAGARDARAYDAEGTAADIDGPHLKA